MTLRDWALRIFSAKGKPKGGGPDIWCVIAHGHSAVRRRLLDDITELVHFASDGADTARLCLSTTQPNASIHQPD